MFQKKFVISEDHKTSTNIVIAMVPPTTTTAVRKVVVVERLSLRETTGLKILTINGTENL